MKQTRPWTFVLAGMLAGLSLILAVMLFVSLLLLSVALWQYAFNSQIPVIQQTAWLAVLQDVNRLPNFLWEWRWIVVGLMVSGTLLAVLDRFVQRYTAVWRNRIAVAVVFAVVGTLLLAGFLINTEQSLLSGADQSESIATLAQRRSSAWNLLFIGAMPTIAAAGALWLGWSWWYAHWRRWLRLDIVSTDRPEPPQSSPDLWFAARQAHSRAQRLVGMLLVGSLVVLVIAVSGYEQVRNTIQSGNLWVEPAAPSSHVQLTFVNLPRQLLVENTYGTGTASVTLESLTNGAPVAATAALTFRDSRVSYEHTLIDVTNAAPGQYQLNAQLGRGSGGRLSYALVESGGFWGLVLAILIGLSGSAALALIVLLLSTLIQQPIAS
jgi:hypothetical protein